MKRDQGKYKQYIKSKVKINRKETIKKCLNIRNMRERIIDKLRNNECTTLHLFKIKVHCQFEVVIIGCSACDFLVA